MSSELEATTTGPLEAFEEKYVRRLDPEVLLEMVGTRDAPGPVDPTRLDVEQRKAIAAYLVGEGKSELHIAELLRVARGTVRSYMDSVRNEVGLTLKATNIEGIAGNICLKYAHYHKRAMKEVNEAKTSAQRLAAIRTAAKLQKDLVEILQKLGVVYREPEKVKIEAEIRKEVHSIQRVVVGAVQLFVPEENREALAAHLRRELGGPVLGGDSPRGTDTD